MPAEARFRIFKDPVSSWTHFIGFWLLLAAGVHPKVVQERLGHSQL